MANEQADANVVLAQTDSWEQQAIEVGCTTPSVCVKLELCSAVSHSIG